MRSLRMHTLVFPTALVFLCCSEVFASTPIPGPPLPGSGEDCFGAQLEMDLDLAPGGFEHVVLNGSGHTRRGASAPWGPGQRSLTELLRLQVQGSSPVHGAVSVSLNTTGRTIGEITSDGSPLPANSTYEIVVSVAVPSMTSQTLQPVVLHALLTAVPAPPGTVYQAPGQTAALHDDLGRVVGQISSLVLFVNTPLACPLPPAATDCLDSAFTINVTINGLGQDLLHLNGGARIDRADPAAVPPGGNLRINTVQTSLDASGTSAVFGGAVRLTGSNVLATTGTLTENSDPSQLYPLQAATNHHITLYLPDGRRLTNDLSIPVNGTVSALPPPAGTFFRTPPVFPARTLRDENGVPVGSLSFFQHDVVQPVECPLPPAGEECFAATGRVHLELENVAQDEITLTGTARMQRLDPTPTNPGTGSVEITSLWLSGSSPLLGTVKVLESEDGNSSGSLVWHDSERAFPAAGTIGLRVEIDAPFGPYRTLTGGAITALIGSIPQRPGTIHLEPAGAVPVYEWSGTHIVGWLRPTLVVGNHVPCSTLESDADGIPDDQDNCHYVPNPGQEDGDSDGRGDVCDNCPFTAEPDQRDADRDFVGDACDNCPSFPNTPQANGDGDLTGDACDCTPGDPANPLPAVVGATLRLAHDRASGLSTLTWDPVPGAPFFNVYRGTIPLSGLATRPGGPYDHRCHESGDDDATGPLATADSVDPAPGTGYYFLVSAENACGESGLGSSSAGTPRPNAAACPNPHQGIGLTVLLPIEGSTIGGTKTLIVAGAPTLFDIHRPVPTLEMSTDGNTYIPFPPSASPDWSPDMATAGLDTTVLPTGPLWIRARTANEIAVTQVTVGREPMIDCSASGTSFQVEFDCGASFDVDGSIVEYRFGFGDGIEASVPTAVTTHDYAGPGTYDVYITVCDDNGLCTDGTWGLTIRSDGGVEDFFTRAGCGCELMTIVRSGESGPGFSDSRRQEKGVFKRWPLGADPDWLTFNFQVDVTLTPGSDPKLCTEGQEVQGTMTYAGAAGHKKACRKGRTGDKGANCDKNSDCDAPPGSKNGECAEYPLNGPDYGNDDYTKPRGSSPFVIKGYPGGDSIRWIDTPGLPKTPTGAMEGNFLSEADFIAFVNGTTSCRCRFKLTIQRNKGAAGYGAGTGIDVNEPDSYRCTPDP